MDLKHIVFVVVLKERQLSVLAHFFKALEVSQKYSHTSNSTGYSAESKCNC